ncbi:FAD-dependent oxidoreductase [Kitasatospora nipponensis]|uniref:FAD-dependent oxidoreductase n=1 Tax=Kitasatospora nipponensis TaxID=258049 RepID=UPI0031E32CE6
MSTTRHDAQLVIVGAGPAGCSAALMAASLGITSIVIEATGEVGGEAPPDQGPKAREPKLPWPTTTVPRPPAGGRDAWAWTAEGTVVTTTNRTD